eukprot:6728336-Pyramimonas_sp.AAC.1
MEGGPNPPGHAAYLPAPARGEPPLRLLRPGAHRAHHRAQLAGAGPLSIRSIRFDVGSDRLDRIRC